VTGPAWYILWLLNSNVVYAFSDGEAVHMAMPSVGIILVAGVFFGVANTAVKGGDVVNVPGGLYNFMMYVLMYCLGIVAKRNNWFVAMEALQGPTVRFLRGLALLCFGFLLLVVLQLRNATVTGDYSDAGTASRFTFVGFLQGFMCPLVSLVLLQFFQRRCASAGSALKAASAAAYAVYIIHPYFIVAGTLAYVQLLRALGVSVAEFARTESGAIAWAPGYKIESENEAYMWFGFAFTSVFCLLAWPLGYCLAKAPGLRHIL